MVKRYIIMKDLQAHGYEQLALGHAAIIQRSRVDSRNVTSHLWARHAAYAWNLSTKQAR